MKALVTGAFGFAGYHLVRHLCAEGDSVLGTYVEPSPSHSLCEAERLDITDPQACRSVLERFQPDAIYHLAGVAFGPEVERNFDLGLKVNVGGLVNVLRALTGLSKPVALVFVSSAEVYGRVRQEQLPVTEQTTAYPMNDYGLTKLLAETTFQRFSHLQHLRPVIIRAFNHIGPEQRPDFVVASFAQQLARIALKKAPPLLSVGNLEAKRDFSDVEDIVKGYRLAALKGRGVYNLCSGHSVSIRSILDQLIEISGCSIEISLDPQRMRPSDNPDVCGSAALALRELGWAGATVPLRVSLERVYKYWFDRESKGSS